MQDNLNDFNLPQPVDPGNNGVESLNPNQSPPSTPQLTPTVPSQPLAVVNPIPAVPLMSAGDDTPQVVPSSNSGSNPSNAADEDLIEKEWVKRAKQIIEITKEDPSAQKEELTNLKVDYVKKRFGKDIVNGDV